MNPEAPVTRTTEISAISINFLGSFNQAYFLYLHVVLFTAIFLQSAPNEIELISDQQVEGGKYSKRF